MNNKRITEILSGEAETIRCAKQFASTLSSPLKVYFSGEIGAGKSCFIRAALQQFGVTQKIKSPTFSMVETYTTPEFDLVHVDLYRIQDEEEYLYLALDEYDTQKSVFFIEWPEKVPSLPEPDIFVHLESIELGLKRKIVIQSNTST